MMKNITILHLNLLSMNPYRFRVGHYFFFFFFFFFFVKEENMGACTQMRGL